MGSMRTHGSGDEEYDVLSSHACKEATGADPKHAGAESLEWGETGGSGNKIKSWNCHSVGTNFRKHAGVNTAHFVFIASPFVAQIVRCNLAI
jgi:hypothetical protein